jgi:hypothetical protein
MIIKMMLMLNIKNDCKVEMFLKDPIPQMTNDCNPSFDAKNCNIPVMALTLNESNTPTSSKVVGSMNFESKMMSDKITIAPKKAAERMVIFPKRNVLRWYPANNVTIATPNEAPELIPRIDGSASGLRNNVCMERPATANAAPTVVAAIAEGNRNFKMMVLANVLLVVVFVKTFHISLNVIVTEPHNIFNRNKNTNNTIKAVKYMALRCLGRRGAVIGFLPNC